MSRTEFTELFYIYDRCTSHYSKSSLHFISYTFLLLLQFSDIKWQQSWYPPVSVTLLCRKTMSGQSPTVHVSLKSLNSKISLLSIFLPLIDLFSSNKSTKLVLDSVFFRYLIIIIHNFRSRISFLHQLKKIC